MSDTIQINSGSVLVPPSTGDNVTETYGVWYPYDGLFAPSTSLGNAQLDLDWAQANEDDIENRGALVLKVTLERIDP